MSSLFANFGERDSIYAYGVTMEDYRTFVVGKMKLATGKVRVTSTITYDSIALYFGVLHLGDHNITCGIGEYRKSAAYETLVARLSAAFSSADIPKIIHAPFPLF